MAATTGDTEAHPSTPVPARAAGGRRGLLMMIIRVLVILAVIVLALRYSRVPERLYFLPSSEPFDTPPYARDVSFTTPGGLTLHGWLMLPRGASAETRVPAVLHVHGNAGNVSSHAAFSDFLPDAGLAVLVFDYRSYGRSDPAPGPLRREALLEDTRAAWNALKGIPEIDPARLGIYGVSIGGAFAAALAAETPEARCLCLASPFSSWAGIAHTHMPLIGPALIVSGMDPANTVKEMRDRPLLVVHGSADTIIPPAHGRAVADAAVSAGARARFETVTGANHNDLIADEPVGRRIVADFFAQNLKTP